MTLGFCLTCTDDVAIGSDRRCLTDGLLCLPPSNACQHMRLIDGAWSECLADLRGRDAKPCKFVAAGTWRNVLAQQQKAVAKRERDSNRAAASSSGSYDRYTGHGHVRPAPVKSMPQPATARTPQRTILGTVPCPSCSTPFRPKLQSSGKRQQACSRTCGMKVGAPHPAALPPVPCPICDTLFIPRMQDGKRRTDCGNHRVTLAAIPCPVCSTPFKPRVVAKGGRRQKVCSQACGNALQLGTTRPNYQRRAS